jgi:hypothetical protein
MDSLDPVPFSTACSSAAAWASCFVGKSPRHSHRSHLTRQLPIHSPPGGRSADSRTDARPCHDQLVRLLHPGDKCMDALMSSSGGPDENGVARLRLMDQAEGVSRQSGPPPGVQLPPDYKWSSWWDTRRGCSLLVCAFGAASLMLSAVWAVMSGWVEAASGLLAGLAAFMAMVALLGVVLPTERGWYWGD